MYLLNILLLLIELSGSIGFTSFNLSTFFLVGYFALFLCRVIELS